MCNGEVGNFVVVKIDLCRFISLTIDNVTLTECFYKLNSFYT